MKNEKFFKMTEINQIFQIFLIEKIKRKSNLLRIYIWCNIPLRIDRMNLNLHSYKNN